MKSWVLRFLSLRVSLSPKEIVLMNVKAENFYIILSSPLKGVQKVLIKPVSSWRHIREAKCFR